MSTTTTNYGLIKPGTDDPILVGQLNDNADVIDATLKSLSDALDVAKLGIKYKGEVNYYSNLPSSGNQIGDAYTVKYAGSSGTTPDGTEYVWGTVSGTNQWINFSKDSYTKAEVDALLSLKANIADIPTPSTAAPAMDGTASPGTSEEYARADHVHPSDTSKQDALTAAQLAAVNSGIDSEKVEQIETNKNNILSIQQEQITQNREIATLREITNCKLYGFKIDKQDVNPDTRVIYLYDAVGMTPAYMDFSGGSFNYGSWADIWFIKNNRPVALKFDGTVDYELSHTDFTKKIDGTASDVEDASYAGNFMSEIPLVYVKRWEDERYNYIVFCETKPNDDYLAQAHTNANGTVNPYIYLPMFKGYKDGNGKLRSLMGTTPWNTTGGASNEVTAASACGDGWQLWDKAKIDLVMDLIVLITKSTSCRAKIGNGVCNTGSFASALVKSGYEKGGSTRSANAQFFGTEGTDSSGYGQHHMCAFYIEDLWGNRWDRCLGFNLVSNVYNVKMVAPYLLVPDSTYQTLSVTPPSSTEGWLKNVSSGVWGDVPTEVGASNTSGFANYFYKNASDNRLSLFGGHAGSGFRVGRCWDLSFAPSNSTWAIGGSPCYNAL